MDNWSSALPKLAKGGRISSFTGAPPPRSMQALFAALAATGRAILPTHPGFDGEARPTWLSTIRRLAECYLALLDEMNLQDVVVVGNSVGGWIAAEMGLLGSPRVGSIVLINAVGIDAEPSGHPIVDPMAVSPEKRAALAFHDPARFAIAPRDPDGLAMMAENQRTLGVYAGESFMHDPTLRARLAGLNGPVLVLWGESDRIVDLAYGRRYAAAIAGSRFEVVAAAGHFPQIEQLDEVQRRIATVVSAAD
ncbi:MAG: hypothetical protein H6Q99_687 [Proteobacteria bacterium]|nr:hypothetical protein [Pseudomonadota bacterium]